MADTQTSSVSTIPFASLPVGTSQAGLQIVAVQNNTKAVRVEWEGLTDNFLKTSATVPGDLNSQGNLGEVYIAEDALWTCRGDGKWGKSPRFTEGKAADDLVASTRFLRVDTYEANLYSEDEQENARKNIGILPATNASLGLIRGTLASFSDGAAVEASDTPGVFIVRKASANTYGACKIARPGGEAVPDADAVVTYAWVMAKFSGLGVDEYGKLKVAAVPKASSTALGCVMPAAEYFSVDTNTGKMTANIAGYSSYGVTKTLSYRKWKEFGQNPPDTSVVPDYSIVYSMVHSVETPLASKQVAGKVQLSDMIYSVNGRIIVQDAAINNKGVVTVATTPATARKTDATNVLSAGASYSLVDDKIDEAFANYKGPIATTETVGYVMPSAANFAITSTGLLTVLQADYGVQGTVKLYNKPDILLKAANDGEKAVSVDTLYSAYSGLLAKITAASKTVADMAASYSKLNTTVTTLKTTVENMQSTVNELDTRVGALEASKPTT